jgi:ribonuclease BN (tRNA processing enzyme)
MLGEEAPFDLQRVGAQMAQLNVILFTHFHVDHSGDFPAPWFEERKRPLPIYGPEGNDFMPATTESESTAPIAI